MAETPSSSDSTHRASKVEERIGCNVPIIVNLRLDEIEWRRVLCSLQNPHSSSTFPSPVFYLLLGSSKTLSATSLTARLVADNNVNYDCGLTPRLVADNNLNYESSEFSPLYEREAAQAEPESNPGTLFWFSNEICGLLGRASSESAVVIAPVSPESDLSLLEFAVAHSNFRGPLIAVQYDKEPWGRLENVSWFHIFTRHILLQSINSKMCSQFAAQLANMISGRDSGTDTNNRKNAITVLWNAGISEVKAAAEAVKLLIPLVILEGSGGFCDWLPSLFRTKDCTEFTNLIHKQMGHDSDWSKALVNKIYSEEESGSSPCPLHRAFSEQDDIAMYLQKIKDGFSRGLVIVHGVGSPHAGSLIRRLDEMSFRGKPCVVVRKRIQAFRSSDVVGQVKEYQNERVLYVHGIPPSCDMRSLENIMHEVAQKEEELYAAIKPTPALLCRSGVSRPVYFLTVGASAIYKIRPKGDAPDEPRGNAPYEVTSSFLEPKKFVDFKTAQAYVTKKFHDPNMAKFEVYCLPTDQKIQFEITQTLTALITEAKKQNAVLIIPDYNSGSPGSLLIEKAIEQVDFRGPVINCGNDNWTAYDEVGLRQQYTFNGNIRKKPYLLRRATHSFLVEDDEMSYSRLAALLAKLISGNLRRKSSDCVFDHDLPDTVGWKGEQQTSEVDDCVHSLDVSVAIQHVQCSCQMDKTSMKLAQTSESMHPRSGEGPALPSRQFWVAVMACGGQSVVQHVSETVRQGMPLIILHGSGRACDYLPGFFYNRFKSGFNGYDEGVKVSKLCGFESSDEKQAVDQLFARSIQIILGDYADVRIYVLGSGEMAMQRILENLNQKDKILDDAITRLEEYTLAANNLQRPNYIIRFLKIGIGLIITLLSTVQSQIILDSSANTIIHFILVVLPVVFSVIMSMEQDFNYNKQQTMLRFCGCRLESEIYQYRMHSGRYSDMALGKKAANTISGQNVNEMGGAPSGLPYICTVSERAQALTEAMIEIGSCIKAYDRSSLSTDCETRAAKRSKIFPESRPAEKVHDLERSREGFIGNLSTKWKLWGWAKGLSETSPASLTKDGPKKGITGDIYVEGRVVSLMKWYEREADGLAYMLFAYKLITYLLGAGGSIMTLMGQGGWLPVTTAFLTSFATMKSLPSLEQRVKRLRLAVTSLENVATQWNVLPKERRKEQENIDTLVEHVESTVISLQECPRDVEEGKTNSVRLMFSAAPS